MTCDSGLKNQARGAAIFSGAMYLRNQATKVGSGIASIMRVCATGITAFTKMPCVLPSAQTQRPSWAHSRASAEREKRSRLRRPGNHVARIAAGIDPGEPELRSLKRHSPSAPRAISSKYMPQIVVRDVAPGAITSSLIVEVARRAIAGDDDRLAHDCFARTVPSAIRGRQYLSRSLSRRRSGTTFPACLPTDNPRRHPPRRAFSTASQSRRLTASV